MPQRNGPIEVDGLRELNFAIRRAVDRGLPKRIGQANKKIGQLVISKLEPQPTPAAVGSGRGASVRASATKREVLLRVGGAHRAGKTPFMQWGLRPGRSLSAAAPPRPFIQGTAQKHRDEIEEAYLKAISEAMDPAFYDTEP